MLQRSRTSWRKGKSVGWIVKKRPENDSSGEGPKGWRAQPRQSLGNKRIDGSQKWGSWSTGRGNRVELGRVL
jgi:hypothetical protein